MKKYIFLCSILILLSGCSLSNKSGIIEDQSSNTIGIVSGEQNSSPINPYPSENNQGDILSGELFSSGTYSILSLSKGILNYDDIFTLNIDGSEYNHWDYSANHNLLSGTYTEAWFVTTVDQNRYNTINIYQPSSSLSYILPDDASDEEKCSVSRDEGQTIIKPKKYESNGFVYYSIDEKFSIPSIEQGDSEKNNYQTTICFVKNDKVYTIIIGNSERYRKDIIDSIKFL